MRVVVAVGGNVLLRRGERPDAEVQTRNARLAAESVAALLADHDVVITHGNGPQVGLLALQADALPGGAVMPLDVLGAESQGLIGYLLGRELTSLVPGRQVATLLTQTLVDRADPAFAAPTKPIGPVYTQAKGLEVAAQRGWAMLADGDGLRRVVASPAPVDVVQAPTIRQLVDQGVVVICAGGGGVPVARDADGRLRGVEAVIDKDAVSAQLAQRLGADALLLLTDVDAVYRDWPANRDPIRRATAAELAPLAFAAGSMGPKVRAACAFAASGGISAIGTLAAAAAVLDGTSGTLITPS